MTRLMSLVRWKVFLVGTTSALKLMAPVASGTAHVVTALLYATRKDIQWEKMAIISLSLD